LNTTSQKAEDDEWYEDDDEDDPKKRNLRKELEDLKASINDQVADGVAARLNKSGFKEANTLKAPALIDLGAGEAPISKNVSTQEDLLDILVKMDDKEVRRLEGKVMAGDYEGVPHEILQSFGITG
jgi:hypothetical protein